MKNKCYKLLQFGVSFRRKQDQVPKVRAAESNYYYPFQIFGFAFEQPLMIRKKLGRGVEKV